MTSVPAVAPVTQPVPAPEAPSTPTPAVAAPVSEPAKSTAKPAKKPAPKGKTAKAKKPSGASGKNKGVEGPAVLRTYAPNYVKGGKKGDSKTVAGNKTIDNGDKLSEKLRGLEIAEVYKLAVETLNKGLEEGEKAHTVPSLKAKYGALNLGMQRMNLGNRMRAVLGLTKSGKKAT